MIISVAGPVGRAGPDDEIAYRLHAVANHRSAKAEGRLPGRPVKPACGEDGASSGRMAEGSCPGGTDGIEVAGLAEAVAPGSIFSHPSSVLADIHDNGAAAESVGVRGGLPHGHPTVRARRQGGAGIAGSAVLGRKTQLRHDPVWPHID